MKAYKSISELRIVVVADALDYNGKDLQKDDRRIDRACSKYVHELVEALKQKFESVILYTSPDTFSLNIERHKLDVVLPYWYGQDSRNRHALIPSICEANSIIYLGGDAYTKVVCNDKALSKVLCKQAGLNVANDVVIQSEEYISYLENIIYPCVVKPMYEGTSLGIGQDNLVYDKEKAAALTLKLLKEFKQPAIVEEFISGREVSFCMMGWKDNITHWHAGERYKEDKEEYFFTNLYGFEEKKHGGQNLALRSVKNLIPQKDINSCFKLFSWLDKVEYMRIDGKLSSKGFTVLELTPETHLGNDAEFCGTISLEGLEYEEILYHMVFNAVERYRNLNSN